MPMADDSHKQYLSNEDLTKRMLAEDFIEVFKICEGFLEFDLSLEQVGEMVLGIVKSPSQKMIAQRIIEDQKLTFLDSSVLMPEFPFENLILHRTRPSHPQEKRLKSIRFAGALLNIFITEKLSEKEKFIRRLVAVNKHTYASETLLCKILRDVYTAEGKEEEAEVFGRIVRNLERGHELHTAINFWLPSHANILLQKANSQRKTIEGFEMLIKLNLSLETD